MAERLITILISVVLAVAISPYFSTPASPVNFSAPTTVKHLDKDKLIKDIKDRTGFHETDTKVLLQMAGHLAEFDGAVLFRPSVDVPPCDETIRGALWFVPNDEEGDTLLLCVRSNTGSLVWRAL